MIQKLNKRHFVAFGVLLVSLATYLMTVAPTVSFWDCGEFIACANIMGIPHPPGTPLFMLLGRTAILLFGMFEDVAYRVNLISVLASAFGVLFAFLFTEKLLSLVLKRATDAVTLTAGVVAAMLLNFSDTYWFNAVEAEVYGLAMCVIILVSWLSLLWVENKDNGAGERYLLLIGYLAFLGIGFHLYTVITFPALFVLMLLVDPKMRVNWPLWITGALLLSVIYKIDWFIAIALGTLVAWLVVTLSTSNQTLKRQSSFCMWFAFLALVGFSSYAYIPIRSELNPRIDENNPEIDNVFKLEDWKTFNDFVGRKQYGSHGMLERSMHRRAQLANQLFSHPHMGYGGYMLAQYTPWKVGEGRSQIVDNKYKGKAEFVRYDSEPVKILGITFPTQMQFMPPYTGRLLQILWFVLFHIPMIWGGYMAYKQNRSLGIYILLLYVITSIGLVFYLNFSDGTRSDLGVYEQWQRAGADPNRPPQTVHMEVRERDYFFVPGFMFMSVLLGLAAGFFVKNLRERRGATSPLAKVVAVGLIVVSIVVPASSNWYNHDRSKVYIPYDYAKNLLASCLPNSVLFTNGDNDTFPLWFMQEVENFRKDVKVVNLSLSNTKWYIHQLADNEPKLTLGFSKDQIDALQPQLNPLETPKEIELKSIGLTITLEGQQQRPYYKVQDLVAMNVIQNNFPERPIHVAITVGMGNMLGFQEYMKMDGMVYTLTNEKYNQAIDVERTAYLTDSVYVYRGLQDNDFYISGDSKGLLGNYFSIHHQLARWAKGEVVRLVNEVNDLVAKETKSPSTETRKRIAEKKAEIQDKIAFGTKYIERVGELVPWNWRHYLLGGQFYMEIGDTDKAVELLKTGIALDLSERDRLLLTLGETYERSGKLILAKSTLEEYLKEYSAGRYIPYVRNRLSQIEDALRNQSSQ
jgi:tetratricopeptide (TPR) repeat protein